MDIVTKYLMIACQDCLKFAKTVLIIFTRTNLQINIHKKIREPFIGRPTAWLPIDEWAQYREGVLQC